jgi:hypothetical protein
MRKKVVLTYLKHHSICLEWLKETAEHTTDDSLAVSRNFNQGNLKYEVYFFSVRNESSNTLCSIVDRYLKIKNNLTALRKIFYEERTTNFAVLWRMSKQSWDFFNIWGFHAEGYSECVLGVTWCSLVGGYTTLEAQEERNFQFVQSNSFRFRTFSSCITQKIRIPVWLKQSICFNMKAC